MIFKRLVAMFRRDDPDMTDRAADAQLAQTVDHWARRKGVSPDQMRAAARRRALLLDEAESYRRASR